MAKLSSQTNSPSKCSLELTPLPEVSSVTDDGYQVKYWLDDQVLFSAESNGHQGEMGHFYLTLVGEAFLQAASFDKTFVEFENQFCDKYSVPVTIQVGTPLVELFLTGYQNESGEWIEVDILLAMDWTTEPKGYLVPSYRASIRASVAAAKLFGEELLDQLQDLADQRRQHYCKEDEASPIAMTDQTS